MKDQEDTVGRLLEGTTNFSRAERDEIFDGVFATVEAESPATATARPGWLTWFAWAAVICLAVVPISFVLSPSEPEFTARGESGNLELQCSGAAGCAIGDTLTFELSAAPHPWFAAFARGGDGSVVWYFPEAASGTSIAVEDGLLRRSVTLGDEHGGGKWTVYGVFSAEPLDRDAVRASFDDQGKFSREDATLIKRTLTLR